MLILEWKKSAGADEDSRELLRFDVDHLTRNAVSKVKCSEVCFPRGEPWIWRVKCSLEEDDGGHRIKVRYEEENQTGRVRGWLQRLIYGDDYTGKTTIFVKRNESGKAERTGRFKWDPKAQSGEIEGRWRAIDGPRPTRTQKQQVRDWRLRADLLAEDGKCVMSGETMAEILETAHIVPVKEGGEDSIENAIMLRTDVHRLYDHGMFRINPKDGKVNIGGKLSGEYSELLRNAKLPPETLKRVRKALQAR